MSLNERNIFLLDGIGAIVSAVFTGVLLPLISEWLGLSRSTLCGLAVFPVVYGIYSLCCYWLSQTTKAWMLKVIIFGNLIYCLVSVSVIISHPNLTLWGRLFLIGEVIILIGVISLEIKIYKKHL